MTELTQKLRAARRRPPSEEPLDDPEDTLEDKPCPEEDRRLTLARIRPETKYNYKPEDLKSDTVAAGFVFEATRLARYISSRQVEGDKELWIRFHLYEAKQKVTEKDRIYYPTWKVGNRDVLALNKKQGYTAF